MKLGPPLWLFYISDHDVDGFKGIEYAEVTTFYNSFGKKQEVI